MAFAFFQLPDRDHGFLEGWEGVDCAWDKSLVHLTKGDEDVCVFSKFDEILRVLGPADVFFFGIF